MLEFLYTKITSPKKVVGVDINCNTDGSYIIFLIELTLDKNSISITDKSSVNSFDDIFQKIVKGIPVFVNLSGKGVLTKKINGEDLSISQILPNINIEDFYTQRISNFLSVSRRDVIDEIVQLFSKQEIDLLGVSLNGLPVENLIGLLNDKPNKVSGSTLVYQIEEEEIVEVSTNTDIESKDILVGDEWLSSDYLVAYSLAFQELLHQVDSIGIEEESITLLGDEFKQKQLFKRSGIGILGGVLFVLVINFFFFSSFRNTNQELVGQLGMYEGQIKKIESLQKEVESKNNFLTKTGWLNPSKASYYSDQIGETVPKSIRLTQLQLNPIDKKKTKKQKETIFTSNLILVSGTSKSSMELNKWIKVVKELDWVSNAEVLDYEQKTGSRNAEFTIEVILN